MALRCLSFLFLSLFNYICPCQSVFPHACASTPPMLLLRLSPLSPQLSQLWLTCHSFRFYSYLDSNFSLSRYSLSWRLRGCSPTVASRSPIWAPNTRFSGIISCMPSLFPMSHVRYSLICYIIAVFIQFGYFMLCSGSEPHLYWWFACIFHFFW